MCHWYFRTLNFSVDYYCLMYLIFVLQLHDTHVLFHFMFSSICWWLFSVIIGLGYCSYDYGDCCSRWLIGWSFFVPIDCALCLVPKGLIGNIVLRSGFLHPVKALKALQSILQIFTSFAKIFLSCSHCKRLEQFTKHCCPGYFDWYIQKQTW